MADFSQYATPTSEWLEFEKTWTPPAPPASATVQAIRNMANLKSAQLFLMVLGRPEQGLEVVDHEVATIDGATIPVRLYRPSTAGTQKLPLVISLHGGGFHLGSLETEDPMCRHIALGTGIAVLNVNYRHSPEYTFPTPVNDVWDAFLWVQKYSDTLNIDPSRIFITGVSSGASLAISIALRALRKHDIFPVKGLVLNTPSVVHPDHFPFELIKDGCASLQQNAEAPFIDNKKLRRLIGLYQPEPTHPEFSNLLVEAEVFRGLCPTSFHIAGRDPLRDEGLLLEEKLRSVGISTTLQVYQGLPHAFMSLPTLPSSSTWRQSLLQDIKGYIV